MPIFSHQVTTEVEFEVFCGKCGAGLCSQSTVGYTNRRGMPFVSVEPCETCLNAEYDRGRSDEQEQQSQ